MAEASRTVVPFRARAAVRVPPPAPSLFSWSVGVVVFFMVAHDFPTLWFRRPASDEALEVGSSGFVGMLLIAALGVALSQLSWNPAPLIAIARMEPLLPLFVGLAVASYLWSSDPSATLRQAVALLVLLLLGYWLVALFRLSDVLLMVSVALALGAVLHFLFIFGLPQYGTHATGEWAGLMDHKNGLGRLGVFSVIHFLLAARVFPRYRVFWLLMAAAAVVLVFGSASKTALASLIVLITLMLVAQAFRARRTLYGAVIVTLVGGTALGLLIATANLGVVAGWLGKDVTLTGRTELWEMSLAAARERLFFGHGWGAFWGGWFSPGHEIWASLEWNPPHAHNALLDYLLYLGVLGAVLFLALVTRFMVRAVRTVRLRPGALGLWPVTYAGFVVMFSVTESGVIGRTAFFLLLVVLVSAAGMRPTLAAPPRPDVGAGSARLG